MAAARAVLFLISIVCSLESLIRNPPKIKHPQATAAQVDGGIGAVFHRAGQGVLDLRRPFALINRWRPLGRVPAPSLPLAVHGGQAPPENHREQPWHCVSPEPARSVPTAPPPLAGRPWCRCGADPRSAGYLLPPSRWPAGPTCSAYSHYRQ